MRSRVDSTGGIQELSAKRNKTNRITSYNVCYTKLLRLGPVPTPAVGMLTRGVRADVGVMISASHNPYEDNGIKLFGPDGYKLSDAAEAEIV